MNTMLFFSNHSLFENIDINLNKIFQKFNKNWTDIPKWSAYLISYIFIATCVSYAINAENKPIPK